MSLLDKHEEYTEYSAIWQRCRDCIRGQDAIHSGGVTYLPRLDKQNDDQYAAYVARARFFNASKKTVASMLGLVSRKEAYFEPEDDYFSDIDNKETDITEYGLKVLRELMIVGRAGTLIDYPYAEGTITRAQAELMNMTPIWGMYIAENIYNWTFEKVNNVYQLTRVFLFDGKNDETYHYRELLLEDNVYIQRLYTATSEIDEPVLVGEILPRVGAKPLNYIPFELHSLNRSDEVEVPPLLDLFDTNIKHYQLKADHAHALHYVALPTPYTTGVDPEDAPDSIGPQRIWSLPMDATVGMLEFSGSGISAIEKELDRLETHMAQLGTRMLSPEYSRTETATASEIKSIGETSTLSGLVRSVNKQVTKLMSYAYAWLQKPDDGLQYQLNTDFMPSLLKGQDLLALVQAWQAGAISKEVLFYNLQQGEIIPDDTEFEDEQSNIDSESLLGFGSTEPELFGEADG